METHQEIHTLLTESFCVVPNRFPLARLDIVTVVVSRTESVLPFQILRCLQCFRESTGCVRLHRFFDHRQLSFLMYREKPQESCFNVLEITAPLSLDDAACSC